ncbi:Fe3+-siderophore transport system permease [Renibacterium salmoninarum ATCC 33209]|uniref:Fe3+-siderophore transport system permease n=1 Tax=Renibacterium salmoninarum (strain ATCC 33209 / DSM 20767 / JCM 11484 / NBRC 15589 / NCIMB 2235) TaxID=288705 RepID=A9WTR3_RENSM|nr:iron chelate uptake ABC transporter family permease subunit [Renibacterium salmoninarum]ABY24584.1 Fe3+-siderophore transport system permease [Renibacterium salmoninarum ATCC 33209]
MTLLQKSNIAKLVNTAALLRAVLGLLVGAAFGVSGVIFQTLLRNPLASPDIIGISGGASATAVAAIVLFSASGVTVSVLAIIGAILIALLISALAGRDSGGRLILIGIGIAAMADAFVIFIMQRAEINRAQDAMLWLTGSLNSANLDRISAFAYWPHYCYSVRADFHRQIGWVATGR